MPLELVLCFAVIVFAIQLFLCFVSQKEWQRFLPLSLAVGF